MSTSVCLVTCSRNRGDSAKFYDSFTANGLEVTTRYEATARDSIGEGFNEAIGTDGFGLRNNPVSAEFYCFTHDDVTMWAGPELWNAALELAAKPDTGFVGVAGATSLGPDCVWWQAPDKRGAVAHQSEGLQYMSFFGPYGRALVLDGVLLIASRRCLEAIGPWPEDLGWHFYDIAMTLRAHCAGFKNYVVPLPILHGSVGQIGDDWQRSRMLFRKKYAGALPVALEHVARA